MSRKNYHQNGIILIDRIRQVKDVSEMLARCGSDGEKEQKRSITVCEVNPKV